MPANQFGRYVWLIDTLRHYGHLTYKEEIEDAGWCELTEMSYCNVKLQQKYYNKLIRNNDEQYRERT